VALVAVVGAGVLLIAGANYFSTRCTSAPPAETGAAVLLSGKNYAVFDANMDFRGLRREAIAQMTGRRRSSRSGAAVSTGDAGPLPGKSFYNGFVHNDTFEDLVAFFRTPLRTQAPAEDLVLTVRYKTSCRSTPCCGDRRVQAIWSEYRSMRIVWASKRNPCSTSFHWVIGRICCPSTTS